MARRIASAAIATFTLIAASLARAQGSDAEKRLRDMLRQTTLELRDAQSQNAQLRVQLGELQERLVAKSEAKPVAPKADDAFLRRARDEAASLRRTLEARDQALTQWKQAYEKAVQLAQAREAETKQLDQQRQVLVTRTETCERDNAELVGIGQDLLARYRDKGVWDALRDAEPVTGIHRVQLETFAQQYHAKLVDFRTGDPDSGVAPVNH